MLSSQLANIPALVAGCFIALLQMSCLCMLIPSYDAASEVQLICIDSNYELISCSGLFFFCNLASVL